MSLLWKKKRWQPYKHLSRWFYHPDRTVYRGKCWLIAPSAIIRHKLIGFGFCWVIVQFPTMVTNWVQDSPAFGMASTHYGIYPTMTSTPHAIYPHYALYIVPRSTQSPLEWERKEWILDCTFSSTPALGVPFFLLSLILPLRFCFATLLVFALLRPPTSCSVLYFFCLLLLLSSYSSNFNPIRTEHPPPFFSISHLPLPASFSPPLHPPLPLPNLISSSLISHPPLSPPSHPSFFLRSHFRLLFFLLLCQFSQQPRLILSTTKLSSVLRGQPHGVGST